MPNEQEQFWSGEFGDIYTDRCSGGSFVAANRSFFAEIFLRTGEIGSAIEFGANRGLNLLAIRDIHPDLELAAVEINAKAADELRKIDGVRVYQASLLEDFNWGRKWSLSFTKGVLIHIHGVDLPRAYEALYAASGKYILVAEYFSLTPVAIDYRGNENKLFKRNFGAEIGERFPDLKLVADGFAGKSDGQDDLTWWLWEKTT